MTEEETNLLSKRKMETSPNNGGSISRRESLETNLTTDTVLEPRLQGREELESEEDGETLPTIDLVCLLSTEEINAEFLKLNTTRMDILLSESTDKLCISVETTKVPDQSSLRRLDQRTKDGASSMLMHQSSSRRKESGHSMLDTNSTFKDHSESSLDSSQREL